MTKNEKSEARLLDDKHLLERLVRAAQAVHDSIENVYCGYPSKLDWPELHELRQALEAVGKK
jgi:hypothetical protein